MDLGHHGSSGLLVGGCMLAAVEVPALDQPGQACILVPRLRQRCVGTQILHLQHLVERHNVSCFPMLLDGFIPVGVGDVDPSFDLSTLGAGAGPSQ